MSKYRNALQKAQSLAINKVNTLALGPSKNEQRKDDTLSTTATLPQNKTTNLKKANKIKLSFDKVLLVLSRIHHSCNLKFQTFCLAIQLYKQLISLYDNPEEVNINCGQLILSCIFLSMKYNQIYHFIPSQLMGSKFKLADYLHYEALIYRRLGSSMDFKTAKVMLDQLLQNSRQEVFFFAYYLLEIAYNDKKITQEYTTQQICKVIYFTMLPLHKRNKKMKQIQGDQTENLVHCSKLLIRRKSKHTQQESPIYIKYCKEKYLKVAVQPYIQLKIQDL